jgi:uncharacterized protein
VATPVELSRDLRPRSILEPIHGLIRLTDLEFAVLDHPLFQRLRKIKQNGLLYLVFPSATHHRFEHSLGALFVADSMLESVWLNSVVSRGKGTVSPFGDPRGDVAIDLSEVPEDVRRWVMRVTRLAALVHDLGHGPLSHTFDSFAPFRDDLRAILKGGGIPSLQSVANALSDHDKAGAGEGTAKRERVPHEVMSCVFFAYVWGAIPDSIKRDSISDGDEASYPLAVAASILGLPHLVGPDLAPERKQWIPFIHDLVASAPADADRMDYLERDSRALGVTYGLFDRNRVLKSLLCFRKGSGRDATYRLGIKRSGMPALENLVQARFELYVQVYYHKTNTAVNLMLNELARKARKAKIRLFPVDRDRPEESLHDVVQQYVDLSDDQFLRVLRGLSGRTDITDEIKALADAVERRQLWKRLYEGDEKTSQSIADQLRAEEREPNVAAGVVQDVSKPGATKDFDEGATLLVRGADDLYAPLLGESWYGSSIIIKALHEAQGNIGRIYAKGAALEQPALERLKSAVRRLASVNVQPTSKKNGEQIANVATH